MKHLSHIARKSNILKESEMGYLRTVYLQLVGPISRKPKTLLEEQREWAFLNKYEREKR